MRGEKELFSLYCGGETEACAHVYTAAPWPPGKHKWGPRPEEAISHGPYSPPVIATLVLCGRTVSSVKELIQVKINHFSGKLVLPWWPSCSSTLYSCTNSYVNKKEERARGQEGEGADRWAGGVQDAPEELHVSSWCLWNYSGGLSLEVILHLTSPEMNALNLANFSKVM